ncbi:unnamed protein product, partial [Medioppia subpectinata]
MDKAMSKLIVIGQKSLKFPTTARQLRPYCNHALKTLDQITAYSEQCMSKFGRDAAKVLLHSVTTELRGVCKTGRLTKRAKDLMKAAPCANAGLKNFQKCNTKLIEKFTGVMNAPVKQRIPMSCCNFHQLIRCLADEADDVKQCSRKTVDFIVKYVNKLIEPILMIMCTEYSEPSDRCDALVERTPNATASQRRYKSFLMPIINVAMSLGDESSELA